VTIVVQRFKTRTREMAIAGLTPVAGEVNLDRVSATRRMKNIIRSQFPPTVPLLKTMDIAGTAG
jgi:hypothetical protein